MEGRSIDAIWNRGLARGRSSYRGRVARWKSKRWHIAQSSVAAAVAWLIASEVLGHDVPVFAAVAAVVSLGTSYGQRLRRVVEVTVGVALGVFLADLLVATLGAGWWQLGVVVGLAMSVALLLDGGTMLLSQAAIQGVFVVGLLPGAGASLTRWTDALVGGAVALAAATLVPSAPLRRPREQAAVVLRKQAELLRGAADVILDGDAERGLELLADARSTDPLVRELKAAADEGMAVVASSPFRVRHGPGIRRMVDMVSPMDRAIRSTRVLMRQVAVAAYHRRPVPASYAALANDLAHAVDVVAAELDAHQVPVAARSFLVRVGLDTGRVERSPEMTGDVVLAQLRSIVVDLLMLTGMDQLEATDALPPPPR
ncbi:hypothetical protein I601_0402 [Nocardioides dokdonensis FR1436]|uniref:Integral membrane bound transporter domain-containing protein n=1 Tax=Nocardioides dokdonensis FR1436 TaxID=1300347 RepID=A0A1A9GF24_9ACTN|nr:FUSC family protein [Nocardioides dokdonensis]ANH36854.1 hypothetical protein I601_0402 [Nocardioides dokdonensis FR1436]